MSSHHDDEHFLIYALPGLLLQGDTLVLHWALRVLSWITAQGTLVEQCRISRDDVALLMALLSAYPSYCPDIALLSTRTGEAVERYAQQISWARRGEKEPTTA